MPIGDMVISYAPAPTGAKFHASDAYTKAIVGPIGSGKSVTCVMEVYLRCLTQRPFNGVRRSRWAIIRNSYPELEATTIKTFCDWIPERKPNGEIYCKVNHSRPPTALLMDRLSDGTQVHAEFHFLSLDKDEDVKKLLSLELTGAWINEAKEVPKSVWDMAYGRTDRYPSKRQGGSSWHGVIMDTNPPDDESDFYKLFEITKPQGYALFKQPPAIVKLKIKGKIGEDMYGPNLGDMGYPPAENVDNHNSGFDYWLRQVHGKDPEWIKVYLMGMYGNIMSGKPVYHEYMDQLHCALSNLEPYRGLPLIIGLDFGLTPSAAICQISPKGQFRTIDELVADDMGVRRFARDFLKPHLMNAYAGMPYTAIGDPAGNQRSQPTEVTCMQELESAGIVCQMARTNEFVARREAVAGYLNRLVEGNPGFLLSPNCKQLRKGFQGGYHYRKIQISGTNRFAETPEKNKFSHCVAKGTMIHTDQGLKKIENVAVGDYVITPSGKARVYRAWMTRDNADVIEILMSTGLTVLLTPDHMIFANGEWKRVDALQYNDVLYCIYKDKEASTWEDLASIIFSYSTGLSTIGSHPDITKPVTEHTAEPGICTGMYGRFITAIFRKTKRFITRMVTKPTTISRILNAVLSKITKVIMAKKHIQKIPKEGKGLWTMPGNTQISGMDPKSDANGTQNTPSNSGQDIGQKLSNAQNAENGMTYLGNPEKRDSVRQHVNQQQGENQESMILTDHVLSAENYSGSINIPKSGHAVRVVGLRRYPSQKAVYDLSVETDHCFFANSILVHNCHDALQYAAMEAEGTGTAANRTDNNSAVDYSRPVEVSDAKGWT
jgi:hypothetical protein